MRVGVVGLGYVGLPLVVAFAEVEPRSTRPCEAGADRCLDHLRTDADCQPGACLGPLRGALGGRGRGPDRALRVHALRAGPGMGGHCLPVDPLHLTWRPREFGMSTEFIELAEMISGPTPYYCAERIERTLNDVGKPVNGSRVAILGVSYKPGVARVRVPHLTSPELDNQEPEGLLGWPELAVIAIAHPKFDHQAVLDRIPQVSDLRGHTRKLRAANGTQL